MADQLTKPSRISGQPHNNFFTSNFKTPGRVQPLLSLAMTPQQQALFDWETLTVESNTITDPQDLVAQYVDLVVKVRLKEHSDVWTSMVIEHKSGSDPAVMDQLLGYQAALYKQGAKLVLPLILYHGMSEWHKQKTFQAFKHAGLPVKLLREFERGRLDFEAFFVWLKDPLIQERLKGLPTAVQLLLHVMANIWEANAEDLKSWFKRFRSLPDDELTELSESVFVYFMQVRQEAVKISEIERALEAIEPGDEHMQLIQEKWKEWLPLTVGEIREQGKEEGLEEGLERGLAKGREEGIQQMAIEMARRCIDDGRSDDEIQMYTGLSPAKIKGLRNGRNDI